jgi:hypothetical protein
MTVEDLTPRELEVLQAARAYAAALAVLVKGRPPYTADDVFRIVTTRDMILKAAANLMCEPGVPETGANTSIRRSAAPPVLKP